jgi:hypothetical protein
MLETRKKSTQGSFLKAGTLRDIVNGEKPPRRRSIFN